MPRKSTNRKTNKKTKKGSGNQVLNRTLEQINLHAAGVDVGSEEMWVAVPPGSDVEDVRRFGAYTRDLYAIADWLEKCGVKTVALESTGVYWVPLYEVLEERGFEVRLVDASRVKNVTGRKSDLLDCQWLQQLETYGLLTSAYRPVDEICVLRSLVRHRGMLIESAAIHIQHMQKSLQLMNVRLDTVVTDVTGQTGMSIIKSILAGNRDVKKLAELRDFRCHATEEEIAASLVGNYRREHLFSLKHAVELYEYYREKIEECEQELENYLKELPRQREDEPPPSPGGEKRTRMSFNVRDHLWKLTGVDLFQVKGLSADTLLTIYSEVGGDMSRFENAKRFSSWLRLCPGTKKSGGKVLSGHTLPSKNRAAAAFRQAASTLGRSDTALGAFYRRIAGRKGRPEAVTATAHKLARIYYSLMKHGTAYVEESAAKSEEKYRASQLKRLTKQVAALGYELTPKAA